MRARSTRPVLVVLLTGLLMTAIAGAGEWPPFAGGPPRLFFNPTESQVTPANVGTLRVKWRFHTGAVVTASPSVAVVDLPGEGAIVFARIARAHQRRGRA